MSLGDNDQARETPPRLRTRDGVRLLHDAQQCASKALRGSRAKKVSQKPMERGPMGCCHALVIKSYRILGEQRELLF
jgi:hypothetical protein